MSTKIGHFEILSELAKSPTGTVYKANDPESNQTIALKAIQLSVFGDQAEALEHALLAEAETTLYKQIINATKFPGAKLVEVRKLAAEPPESDASPTGLDDGFSGDEAPDDPDNDF